MEKYIIKGGTPLVGEVEIGGAKNSALALLAATVMTEDTVTIDNLPDVRDINVLIDAIEGVGATVKRTDRHAVSISGRTVCSVCADNEYIKKIRASYYLLGALLGRFKKAEVTLPGGCNIGSRPIDLHIKGFEALGAKVVIEHGMFKVQADKLVGAHIFLDAASVGATINVMLAAALAEGNTVIENAAKEPHIVDVANLLNKMGANIRGAGTDIIRIKGVQRLHGTEYSVIPDQIEAGTFMFAAAITKGDILVKNVIPKHLEGLSAKLMEVGCTIEEYDDAIRVISGEVRKSTRVKTLPYPGFPTDMQPQMTVILSMAQGTSTVIETIFENRFMYVDELTKMGAKIKVEGNIAVIEGVSKLTGASLNAHDLRAGAALVLAGLAAEGFTTVEDIHFIQRGYEAFEEKLSKLGGKIEKVDDDKQEQKFKLRVG